MSNANIGLIAIGVVGLMGMAGGAGFYLGQMSSELAFVKQQQRVASEVLEQRYPNPPVQPQINQYPAAPVMGQAQQVPLIEAPEPVQPSISADGVPSAIAPVLTDAESASGILDALSKASAINAEGDVSNEQPIYAFFDPRCPYCKKAMAELNGRATVKWIPVSLLGDLQSGSNMIEGMKTLDGKESVTAVVDGKIPKATGSAETQGQLQDNAAILFALYEGAQEAVAVPTILVPRGDGTVTFHRGFDDGDGDEIVEAYGS